MLDISREKYRETGAWILVAITCFSLDVSLAGIYLVSL
jgi:hypothetical protein